MNNNTKWIIGLVIAGVVILGGSLIAFGVTKYHKDHPDSSYGSSSTGSSTTGSTNGSNTTAGSNSVTSSQETTSNCSPVSQAASLENTSGCIQFTGYAYTSPSSGSMYLDQSTSAPYGFSAYIPAGSSFGPSLLNQYSGQSIDVTGSIINYNGEPEIVVNSASQITLAQ